MDLSEALFLLSFIGLFVVFIIKFLNVLSAMKLYDYRGVFVTFVCNIIFWGIGLLIFMVNNLSTEMGVIFWLGNGLFSLNWLFLIIEFIGGLGQMVKDQFRQRYAPGKD